MGRSPSARPGRSPTAPRWCSRSLPRPETVADAILGPDGVLAGTAIRTTIDLSTIGADAAREIHAAAAARGLRALDAPVSGGPRGAEQGTLCIMAAGSREVFDAHRDLLAVLGRELVFLGPDPGQGQTMKVLNNMVCASTLAATLEAMVLGAKAGLDADAMLRVLQVSSGRNFHTEDKIGATSCRGRSTTASSSASCSRTSGCASRWPTSWACRCRRRRRCAGSTRRRCDAAARPPTSHAHRAAGGVGGGRGRSVSATPR